jgi:hypothetical protein
MSRSTWNDDWQAAQVSDDAVGQAVERIAARQHAACRPGPCAGRRQRGREVGAAGGGMAVAAVGELLRAHTPAPTAPAAAGSPAC